MPRRGAFRKTNDTKKFSVGFHNFCIYNFGKEVDITVRCVIETYSISPQSFRIFPGRNLICTCKIGIECNARIFIDNNDSSLIWLTNGRTQRNNFLIYHKPSMPTLFEIVSANIFSLNFEYIYNKELNLVPLSICENVPPYKKQCIELLCGFPMWAPIGPSSCTYTTGGCENSDTWDIGFNNCKCAYCVLFDFYPLSPLLKGGGQPEPACPVQSLPCPALASPTAATARYGSVCCMSLCCTM
jgi:hypothetical protein